MDADSFYGWIAIHELTHAFQFGGVPWLREHVGGLMREYLESVELRIEHGNAGALPSLPSLDRLVGAFREGGLAALVQTSEQRSVMARMQCSMAVVEGYAEHVMDALGPRLLPAYDGLREAMERRRHNRSAPERMLQRLLGLDMKLRQYQQGKSFCDAVAASAGIEGLNRVWDEPEAMPTATELKRPQTWIERTAPPARLARGA